MQWTSETKHAIHVLFFLSFLLIWQLVRGGAQFDKTDSTNIDPFHEYGIIRTTLLYILRYSYLLSLPHCIFNALGWILLNCFPDKVRLKNISSSAPFICIRVVTRGLFPDLVMENVKKNMQICRESGLVNFVVEVVTDIALNLPNSKNLREIVVPHDYRTKSGALFKARALQYCFEDNVNRLNDDDWIVHLDEETLLTKGSIYGILNFCTDGRNQFGQGVITYANGEIVNWFTTLADSCRVADDFGKYRFQLTYLRGPLLGWKGSFLVSQVKAERNVGYDHGPNSSVAEDQYFGLIAFRDGYNFGFIEGEMWEKSPFTFLDFIRQRKHWFQGIMFTVLCPKIKLKTKLLLSFMLYTWAIQILIVIFAGVSPYPNNFLFNSLTAFIDAINLYLQVFGMIKLFGTRHGNWLYILAFYTLGLLCNIILGTVSSAIAIPWALLTIRRQHEFYIVQKDSHSDKSEKKAE